MDNKKNEEFLNQTLDQIMSERFGRYSKYIIQDRALPDSRDGFKPVQRRILYSMHELGLFHNKPFKKSARVVGDVIGKYHPHGDTSIYDALVRMSQNWKMNHNLVEMHGNNGSIDDDPAAAMRYTEARLSQITNSLLNNIKKQTVLFSPNFDDSEKEPTVLPALMPNLLINGAKGIAAGYATEMPPHNLGEVVDAIIAKIKSPNARLETLMNYIHGPDFPTGGVIQGKQGIYQAFERGRGKIIIRSKYKLLDHKTMPSITIYEIPFGVVKSKLVREIDEIRFNNKIDGIKDVRDESDRNGLRIVIELNSGANIKQVLNYLLTKTDMQIYYNYNNVAIKDKVPTQMSLSDLIDAYINHQKQVQTKALEFDLKKDKTRLEIVFGLIKVAQIADKVIQTIRESSGSKQGVIRSLIENYQFTELQANAIAELRLYRLSKTDQSIYLEEKSLLQERINQNENLLRSDQEFDKYLISLLRVFKKTYATDRKTSIENAMESISVNMDALIKQENVWVGISQEGYLKKFSNRVYLNNHIKDYALREKDSLKYLHLVSTTDKLLAFTNYGHYYMIPVHKINEAKFKDVGSHINDFASYSKADEHIVSVICVREFDTPGFLVLATKCGQIKRTKISEFEVSRYLRLYTAISLKEKDKLVAVKISNGFKQIIVINNQGLAVKYSETQIPINSTKGRGVKSIKIRDGEVSTIAIASKNDVIGLISHRGGMKRIKESSIMAMNRNNQGRLIFRTLKGNPHYIIDANIVTPKTIVFYSKKNVVEFMFNSVDISSNEEGLSLIGPSLVNGAVINAFMIVHKNNNFFDKPNLLSEEAQFEAAEKTIEAINEISLDDLLKDIK